MWYLHQSVLHDHQVLSFTNEMYTNKVLDIHQQSVRHTSCSVCHKTLATRQSRRRHEKIVHHHIRPFQCQKCPKAFTVKSNLESHQRSDHGEEKLKCPTPEYEATFAYLWSSNEHKKKCGAVNLKVYVCPGCDKIFKHERSMKAHDQSTHHGKKSFCEICGWLTFCAICDLIVHIEMLFWYLTFNCEDFKKNEAFYYFESYDHILHVINDLTYLKDVF